MSFFEGDWTWKLMLVILALLFLAIVMPSALCDPAPAKCGW